MQRTPIDYQPFIHPWDARALAALQSIPLLDTVMRKFHAVVTERYLTHINDATMIRLGHNQLPQVFAMLEEVAEQLGIETPALYLTTGPMNAYTFGDTHPYIVLQSGLLFTCTDEEIKASIAHECGHILCHHTLYSSLVSFILEGSGALFGLKSAIMYPLECALLHWSRCSELSADRVAAYTLRNPEIISVQMQKFARGFLPPRFQINHEAFLEQAEDYEEAVNNSLLDKGIYFMLMKDRAHPFPAKRAKEIMLWYEKEKDNLPPFANEVSNERGIDDPNSSFPEVSETDRESLSLL